MPEHLVVVFTAAGPGQADIIKSALLAAGIPVTPFYPHTLYQNPLYAREKCRVMPCPVAEERIHDSFWLGHRAFLSPPETIRDISGVVHAAVSALRASVLS